MIPKKNWFDAFEDLTEAIDEVPKERPVVLFFDEFPWMATPRSKILIALELYWNRYWVFDWRIKLVICGSSTSWIINNKGGLHNRVTRTFHLQPFSLIETESYLKEHQIKLNRSQVLDLYTVLGGVPLYWSFMRKGLSAHQCIDELCFQQNSPLVNEFGRLFESLFENPKPYVELIRLIARHRCISQAELVALSRLPNGGGTIDRLHQLEKEGFITSLVPHGHKERGVYYVMDDEYSLFYLRWIEPHLKTIAKKDANEGFWLSLSTQSSWKAWAGYAFESTCYKHIAQIRKALKIDPSARAGTWRFVPKTKTQEEGSQIDLLFDRADGSITLCEIKYSDKPFAIDKSYAQDILKKIEVFRKQTKTKKQLFFSMITQMGLKPTMYSEELISSEAALDDLFKESWTS